MFVKKSNGQIFGMEFTAAEKKAMNMEIQRQTAEYDLKNSRELSAIFLWILHEVLPSGSFGPTKMKKVYMSFMPELKALCERYQMTDDGDDLWLCTHKLKEYGVDLEEWDKEIGL